MLETFKKIWVLFNNRERKQFILIFVLMVIGSILEVLGISIILPFVAVILKPDVHGSKVMAHLVALCPSCRQGHMAIVIAVVLIVVFIIKNIFLFYIQYSRSKFVFDNAGRVGAKLLENYLYSPYTFHLQRNSAVLLRNINNELGMFANYVLLPLLTLLANAMMVLAVIVFLFLFDPLSSFIITASMGASVYCFNIFIQRRLKNYGAVRQEAITRMNKQVIQGLGSIKEAKVLRRESFFIKQYMQYAKASEQANCFSTVASIAPRYFIEAVAVVVVLGLMIFYLLHGDNPSDILIRLSIFGIAAIRIMPSASSAVGQWALLRYGLPSLDVVYKDYSEVKDVLPNEPAEVVNMPFEHAVELKNISYYYHGFDSPALENINIEIKKGQAIAFVGSSGAGKTTLIDIILGLLKPSSGQILVDGSNIQQNMAAWQANLGYIPQSIYLMDDSIKNNVAFGVPEAEISEEKLWQVLKMAQLKEFVESLPDGINTVIGELGVRLSGGQRQRIGIARALYHDSEILVMDEATAALDNETEQEVIKAIDMLCGQKTIIIIAHRLSTVKNCNVIYRLEAGKIVDSGSYEKVIGHLH
jgi:ATP-binding cassette subfamily C protein